MATRKQITIKGVAVEAGVSMQTVSRVLNNHPDVAAETRRRVQKVIARLGYEPNALARSLSRQRSHTLGIVTAELEHYGPHRLLTRIEREVKSLNYSLSLSLIQQPEKDTGEQVLRELLGRQVEGIIWAVSEIGQNYWWLQEKMPQLPVPMIFIGGWQFRPDVSVVSVDNRLGSRMATAHLLAQGYRHVGIITGPQAWWVARERLLGWHDALVAAGLRPGQNQIVEGDWTAPSGAKGICQLLEQYPPLDAVVASNDQMALGVLLVAHQSGRRVPDELAVVGYDNMPESAYFWPPLTTVAHHSLEQSRLAIQELSRMIEAQQEEEIVPPQATILKPDLIIRKSSGV